MEYKNIFCSKECEAQFKKSKEMNCECEICHIKFHRKQSWIDKNKNQYCSQKCKSIADKERMNGENNHQYGLKGKLNSSWKSDERISYYGYRLIRVLDHPFKNSDDMVFEHRLVAEKYLLTNENSIEINGKRYLSEEYVVHHIDFDRLNNNVSNLQVMKGSEHVKLHWQLKLKEELEKYCEENSIKYIDVSNNKNKQRFLFEDGEDRNGGFGSTTK